MNRAHQTESDEALVAVAQSHLGSARARSASGELLRRYQRPVYLWCYRYVREHDGALDLAQDVLLKAYEHLPSFEGRSKFSSWLFALTRNHCLNERRRGRAPLDGDDPDAVTDGTALPDRLLEEKEGEEQLLTLIRDTLDTDEQSAIWMRCVDRMSVDEITRILAMDSQSGARALLQRARRKLRARLDDGARRDAE